MFPTNGVLWHKYFILVFFLFNILDATITRHSTFPYKVQPQTNLIQSLNFGVFLCNLPSSLLPGFFLSGFLLLVFFSHVQLSDFCSQFFCSQLFLFSPFLFYCINSFIFAPRFSSPNFCAPSYYAPLFTAQKIKIQTTPVGIVGALSPGCFPVQLMVSSSPHSKESDKQ